MNSQVVEDGSVASWIGPITIPVPGLYPHYDKLWKHREAHVNRRLICRVMSKSPAWPPPGQYRFLTVSKMSLSPKKADLEQRMSRCETLKILI